MRDYRKNDPIRTAALYVMAAAAFACAMPATIAQAPASPATAAGDASPAPPFRSEEFPRKFTKKPQFSDYLNHALSSWREKQYDSALQSCKALTGSFRLSKEDVLQLSELAAARLRSKETAKAVILYLVLYESM